VESAALMGSGDSILSDATDHALATIASILDQGETHREVEKPASEVSLVPPAESMMSPDGEGYSKAANISSTRPLAKIHRRSLRVR
jgi:hypothetical protein